jgi:hypothetical protein
MTSAARCQQLLVAHGVDESALGHVAVRETGEVLGGGVVDDLTGAKSEQFERHPHVAQLRSASHETGSLGSHERDAEGHVVAVVLVFEVESRALTLGDREGEPFAGGLGALAATGRLESRALQTRLGNSGVPVSMVGRTTPESGTGENVGWVTYRDYRDRRIRPW